MDKKSPPQADQPRAEKILLALLLIVTLASVSYTFYKTLVKEDFEVINTESVGEEEASLDE